MGRTIPTATLEFFRADAQGDRIKYYSIDLENVLISMVRPHLDPDCTYLMEQLDLKYSKIMWTYTQQGIGGGSKGCTAGGWNLASNRIA